MSLIVCTDDICPKFIDKYWEHWAGLKVLNPALKLNAFVVPCYMGDKSQLITNKEFRHWYDCNKDWVRLHLHGFDHSYPPEFLRDDGQEQRLIDGYNMMISFVENRIGFKPPGYKFNYRTIDALFNHRFHFMALERSVIYFDEKVAKHIQLEMVQTHTNGLTDDSIEKISEKLNVLFTGRKDFKYIDDESITRSSSF